MSVTVDLGLLVLRATVGGLLAGHGAQKLFGAYGGPGVEGTTDTMDHLGLEPARPLALAAGASELGGGALTAAGLLGPVGPLAGLAAMAVASTTAHAGKPIWAAKGGAELPVTNIAVLAALLIAGHGNLALDRLLGIHVPRILAIPGLAAVAVVTALTVPRASAPAAAGGRSTGSSGAAGGSSDRRAPGAGSSPSAPSAAAATGADREAAGTGSPEPAITRP